MPGRSHFHAPGTVVARVVIFALATAAFVALGGGQALAHRQVAVVKCGDTITADTELTSDLIDCPGDGIVIGADDITLDLDGHTIDGDNLPAPCDPSVCDTDFGVDNTGHSGVTIEGGTVKEFEVGVGADGAGDVRVHGLSASSNLGFGVALFNSTDSRIEKNSLSGNGISGVVLVDSNGNEIERNSLSDNGETAAFLFASNDNSIERNQFDGNAEGIALHESSRNDVRRNSISHSADDAVGIVDGGSGNKVEKNLLIDNGDGVTLGVVDGNLISRNVITGTGFFGAPETGGWAILLDGADNTVIDRNRIEGGRGEAIFVTTLEGTSVTSDHTVVSRNDANSKLSDGIHVSGGATATLIERNNADDNGDDGIDVDEPGTTLTRNSADDNSDLGIEAVPGVTDGGHNRAHGNGNSAQCTNVACR